MSDSDSDCEYTRTSSVEGYKVAPRDQDFKIKIKPTNGKTKALLYTLKSGQSLPYSPELEGFSITFGQDLKPCMGESWECQKRDDCWIFKGFIEFSFS